MAGDLCRRRVGVRLIACGMVGFCSSSGLRLRVEDADLEEGGPSSRTAASSSLHRCLMLLLLLACSCVYISEESSESTSETSALSQCEATIQDIECSFPLELHITIHDGGCAVVCEPPSCPVNNILCVNPNCSVCLPATVELPLEQCQAFLQSCDPVDLGPGRATTSPSDEGSSGSEADTGGSTASPDDTGTTGVLDSTGMSST